MKTLIIGLGSSGKSAASFLLSKGREVIGMDRELHINEEMGFPVFSENDQISLSEVEQVIVSPGISREHPIYKKALMQQIEVIGEAELALRYLNQPCMAITGTNGKTTVTLLTEHILKCAGICARSLGNIGTPLTSYCQNPNQNEILVIELSSFQLETMTTPVFDAGVILNITPDHLDRYPSMREYAAAKCRLQGCLKEDAPFFVNRQMIEEFKDLFILEKTICFNDENFSSKNFFDKSKHEIDNALASWKLVRQFGVDLEQFLLGLQSFKKPSHRIEFVAEIDEVFYYDDSKGTNIDAVVCAVEAMPGKTILIAGGVDKGASYMPWKNFKQKVKKIIVLGQAANKMQEELKDSFLISRAESLEDAILQAKTFAKAGEAVLLSPGCSSFDMFRDYAHRGEEFKRHVHDLQERKI